MFYKTYTEAKIALAKKETTCVQLVSSFLDKIEAENEALNIFLSVDKEGALSQAKKLDDARDSYETLPPLFGMVMGIKDVIAIKGAPLTCGSKMLDGFESLYDATVIERLRDAGAIFIGKLNCDEFAMGSSNENSFFGPVKNPVNPEYVPGGSSGGSAAAIAAEFCHTTLGSDTGGSIRQPAAFCGVAGLKPTYGRVSRSGLVAFASSFDSIGPFGHDSSDLALILSVMAGQDERDSTSAPNPVPDYSASIDQPINGLKIGLPAEYFAEGLDPEIRAQLESLIEKLKSAGAEIIDVSLPHTEFGIAAYYILSTAEASSNLARYDGVRYGYRADIKQVRAELKVETDKLKLAIKNAKTEVEKAEAESNLAGQDGLLQKMYIQTRTEGFGEEVKRRIMLGTYVLSSGYYDAWFEKAQKVRRLVQNDFLNVFEEVDILLTPATPTPAFKLGSNADDPLAMYLNDVYTVSANLAGIPGFVGPLGQHSSGLPTGFQLLGSHFSEGVLLQVGEAAMALSSDVDRT